MAQGIFGTAWHIRTRFNHFTTKTSTNGRVHEADECTVERFRGRARHVISERAAAAVAHKPTLRGGLIAAPSRGALIEPTAAVDDDAMRAKERRDETATTRASEEDDGDGFGDGHTAAPTTMTAVAFLATSQTLFALKAPAASRAADGGGDGGAKSFFFGVYRDAGAGTYEARIRGLGPDRSLGCV